MPVPAEVREVVRGWITKAEDDLRIAEHALALGEECPSDMVCFHAQQCAEKYLEALLAYHGVDPPRTHDLTEILPLLPPGVDVDRGVDELAELNPYAVDVRYPGLSPDPGREEATRAVETARQVRARAQSVLPMQELFQG
jgi:HEPN domain-containing protein